MNETEVAWVKSVGGGWGAHGGWLLHCSSLEPLLDSNFELRSGKCGYTVDAYLETNHVMRPASRKFVAPGTDFWGVERSVECWSQSSCSLPSRRGCRERPGEQVGWSRRGNWRLRGGVWIVI